MKTQGNHREFRLDQSVATLSHLPLMPNFLGKKYSTASHPTDNLSVLLASCVCDRGILGNVSIYLAPPVWLEVRTEEAVCTWCHPADLLICYTWTMCSNQPLKVAVHTCDVLWRENLVKTQCYASLTTNCIVTLFDPIELWSIAMHYGSPLTNSNASWMLVVHWNF